MKNKPFIVLMVIIAVIAGAYFINKDNIPDVNSILVRENIRYEIDK